jgi:hypothetical protein
MPFFIIYKMLYGNSLGGTIEIRPLGNFRRAAIFAESISLMRLGETQNPPRDAP